jgi:hypothetical protein
MRGAMTKKLRPKGHQHKAEREAKSFFLEERFYGIHKTGQSGQSLTVLDTSPLCQINWKRTRSQKTELSPVHAELQRS